MKIDFLKENCINYPWQHGLGFIKLRMKGYELNFHSHLISSPTKNLHSHTKNFISTCLFGKIKNIIYKYEEASNSNWVLEQVTCQAGETPAAVYTNVTPIIVSEEIQNEGDSIFHRYSDIHDTQLLSSHACTKVVNERRVEDALIIRNKSKEFECAYKNLGSPRDNWEIIDIILKEKGA
tara:strand:- start:1015 stop:1551 length:537 start_codon:yes stop_codon:yes gene_type:complete